MKLTIELNPESDINYIIGKLEDTIDNEDEISARMAMLKIYDSRKNNEDFRKSIYLWIDESGHRFSNDFYTAFYYNKEFEDYVVNGIMNYLEENRKFIIKDYRVWFYNEDYEEEEN